MRAVHVSMLLLLTASPARAAAPAEARRLEHSRGPGAESCPDRASTERGVAARLGYRPFAPEAGPTLVLGYEKRGGQLVARITLRDGQGRAVGERRLVARGDDCAELGRRVELAIAIAIDPLANAGAPSIESGEGDTPEFPPLAKGDDSPPPPPEPPAPAPARPPTRGVLRLSGSLGALLAIAAAPAVTGGFALELRLRWRALSLGVGGRVDLPASDTLASGGEVSAGLIVGSATPCYHVGPVAGCAVLLVGALRGSGRGLAKAEDVTLAYAATGARLAWTIPLISRLRLTLHGDLLGTLTRLSLRETSSGAAFWTTPTISAAFGLAATVRLL